jgi:hypothetical protein
VSDYGCLGVGNAVIVSVNEYLPAVCPIAVEGMHAGGRVVGYGCVSCELQLMQKQNMKM